MMNYKGKLANVTVRSHHDDIYYVFDLWVLEDANEHRWSMRQCSFLRSWWNFFGNIPISFQGTNKIGEIIIAPKFLPWDLQPFYIHFFNVENNNIRKVQVKGIVDDEGFRHR